MIRGNPPSPGLCLDLFRFRLLCLVPFGYLPLFPTVLTVSKIFFGAAIVSSSSQYAPLSPSGRFRKRPLFIIRWPTFFFHLKIARVLLPFLAPSDSLMKSTLQIRGSPPSRHTFPRRNLVVFFPFSHGTSFRARDKS